MTTGRLARAHRSGSIEVKLAGSLICISSIHLLLSFIQLGSIDASGKPIAATDRELTQIGWRIVLHPVFLISTVMLALTETITHRRHRPGEGPHGDDATAAGAPTRRAEVARRAPATGGGRR